jgi:hypothetical protein
MDHDTVPVDGGLTVAAADRLTRALAERCYSGPKLFMATPK